MNVTCTSETCPLVLNSKCVFYESTALPYTGINTNDSLQVALQKLEIAIQDIVDAGGGGAVWGAITGTITNQTDLINYLAANYTPQSRTITINGVVFDLSDNRSWTVSGAIADGDKGDILVSGSGAVWTVESGPFWKITGTTSLTGNALILPDGNNIDFGTAGNLVGFNVFGSLTHVGAVDMTASGGFGIQLTTTSGLLQSQLNMNTAGEVTLDASTTLQFTSPAISFNSGPAFNIGGDQVGDMYQRSSSSGRIQRLAAVATGNVIISQGVGTPGIWGKVGLTTHVSGILPVANGGLNLSSISALSIPVANVANTYATITPGAGNSIRVNAGGTAWEAYTPGGGGISGLTANRIPYADSATSITDDSALTWSSGTNIITINNLRINSTGTSNTFMGQLSGNTSLSGSFNTYYGALTGRSLTSGSENTCVGYSAGDDITEGTNNTAIGTNTLNLLTTGDFNTALGDRALATAITANSNTSVGYGSLNDTTGSGNIALGYRAGEGLTSGNNNIIIGYDINVQTITGDNQLTIQNIIFGAGNSGTLNSISTGGIGIGIVPGGGTNRLSVKGTGNTGATSSLHLQNSDNNAALNVDDSRNINIGASTYAAGPQGVVMVSNAPTPPVASPTQGIFIHSQDSSTGNATLGLYLEQPLETIGTFVATHKIRMWINGQEFWLSLDAVLTTTTTTL